MSDRELMQQALEALDGVLCDPLGKCCIDGSDADRQIVDSALDALRERLSQPEQEPVKFKCTVIDDANPNGVPLSQWGCQSEQEPFCYHDGRNIVGKEFADHSDVFPLYTAPQPRQWQGLTDEETDELVRRFSRYELLRAIEAKLKEKNT